MKFFHVKLIISGGQTGADRAGLDFALAQRIPHGGFCPVGRKAEDGVIPSRYRLEERGIGYSVRTLANVNHADATIIFTQGDMGAGSRLTEKMCDAEGKPYLVIDPADLMRCVLKICLLLNHSNVRTLNIAGSREQSIYPLVLNALSKSKAVFDLLSDRA